MKHTEQKIYFDDINITRAPILRQSLKRSASKISENSPLKRPRLKKAEGRTVQAIENNLAKLDLKMTTTVGQAMNIYQSFYNSRKRIRHKRTCEVQNDSFRRRLCAKERMFLIGKKADHVLGTGIGSTTKEFRRYGEKWKQELHGMNVNVCIAKDSMTSQTCIYCFSKLVNPMPRKTIKDKEIKTKVKGSFLCRDPDYVLVSNKKAIKPRDDLSAVAIDLSGLSSLLSQETFPELSAKISQSNTEFINKTASFLNKRE
ncbi:hypothetical protein AB4K20DRAFT_1975012 [Rhizopus microsporus]